MLGSHRDNAHFSRARWRKRVILPCWIIQVLILLSVMGLFSWRLSRTVTAWEEEEEKGDVPVVEFVWEVANIAFSLVSLVITLVSIARFIAEVLTPLPLLFGCILNIVLSGAVLALDIVIYIQRADKNYSLIGLGLDAALILFTVIPLIYAIIIYRRLLEYDDYHLPGNHKAFGFASVEEGVEDASSIYLGPPTPYDPTNSSLGTTAIVTGGEPRSRARSLSTGRRISLSFSRNASPPPQNTPPIPESAHQRRPSYDHKRDTQFDDYVARRTSMRSSHHDRDSVSDGISLQDDVKRALSVEFGFSDVPSPAESGRTNANGEMISSGAVHTAQASRPRLSSIGRQTSYEGLVGVSAGVGSPGLTVTVSTPPEEGLQRGHSLVSVPEAREEEEDHSNRKAARKRAVSESQQALLGESDRRSSGSGRGSPSRIEQVEGLEDIELENKKRRRDS
ncbi:hypothetical protein F5Y19DRAFT_229870 [Xylariaceae sp. FL1651]|nr:hypothetical protein F5Y19DRAFT_229870 [Xylariaceae sp. FL1651]